MRRHRTLAAGFVLVHLAGCAGLSDTPVLAPLSTLEPGAGPLEATDAEAAGIAAAQIKSAVISGTLLVGGEAGTRMQVPADAMPAAGDANAMPEAESPTAAAVQQAAALERTDDPQTERRRAQLLEQWMSTRFEPVALSRDDIRQGQRLLAEQGFAPGPIDGIMGPRTRAAIEAFQRAQQIEVTGEMSRSLIDLLAVQSG